MVSGRLGLMERSVHRFRLEPSTGSRIADPRGQTDLAVPARTTRRGRQRPPHRPSTARHRPQADARGRHPTGMARIPGMGMRVGGPRGQPTPCPTRAGTPRENRAGNGRGRTERGQRQRPDESDTVRANDVETPIEDDRHANVTCVAFGEGTKLHLELCRLPGLHPLGFPLDLWDTGMPLPEHPRTGGGEE